MLASIVIYNDEMASSSSWTRWLAKLAKVEAHQTMGKTLLDLRFSKSQHLP
jgi:hypothetical protein